MYKALAGACLLAMVVLARSADIARQPSTVTHADEPQEYCAGGSIDWTAVRCRVSADGRMIWAAQTASAQRQPVAVRIVLYRDEHGAVAERLRSLRRPNHTMQALGAQIIVSSSGFRPKNTILTDGVNSIGFGLTPPDNAATQLVVRIWRVEEREVHLAGLARMTAGTWTAVPIANTQFVALLEWHRLSDAEEQDQRTFFKSVQYEEKRWRMEAL